MIGKIILPLVKIVKKSLWEDLKLSCKGSLIEFYIKLEKSNFDIITIKKLLDN